MRSRVSAIGASAAREAAANRFAATIYQTGVYEVRILALLLLRLIWFGCGFGILALVTSQFTMANKMPPSGATNGEGW
jgi:hypothetical protein